jgi:hypothetical protein
MSMVRHQTAIVEARATWYNGPSEQRRSQALQTDTEKNVARVASPCSAAAIIAATVVVCFVIRVLISMRLGVGNDD